MRNLVISVLVIGLLSLLPLSPLLLLRGQERGRASMNQVFLFGGPLSDGRPFLLSAYWITSRTTTAAGKPTCR